MYRASFIVLLQPAKALFHTTTLYFYIIYNRTCIDSAVLQNERSLVRSQLVSLT